MKRIFLGNDRPLLHLTADYLIRRFSRQNRFDLRNVILTFQEQRAINRLEEILAERVETDHAETMDPAWYPPEFLTIGTLPERFYELKKPLANELTQCFAWLAAIDQLDDEHPDLLRRLIPSPPRRDDLEARMALGKIFAKLHREIAADTLDFTRVAQLCRDLRVESESTRWETLDKLQKKYLARLDSLEIWDTQSARLFALERPEEFKPKYAQFQKEQTQILLVGVVDMNIQQKNLLRHFSDFVTPLVFAPEEWADRFDDLGCLIPDAWQDVPIELKEEQIQIVESTSDQAEAVLRCLTGLNGNYAPPEIIVGVPDKQVVPFIEQQLEQANIKTRIVAGIPIRQTPVYRFLETLLPFLESRTLESQTLESQTLGAQTLGSPTFARFAALVRHPDVETYLRSRLPNPVCMVSALDQCHTGFLPLGLEAVERVEPLQAVWQELQALLDTEDLAAILQKVFAEPRGANAKERDEGYHQILETLLQIQEIKPELLPSRGLSRGAAPSSCVFPLSLVDTLRLVLMQVDHGTIPMPPEPKGVELVGWLDLAMDDAEVVIVTGMNDGSVPAFQTSDMFLPDGVRRTLSIEDNSRRFARDAYAMTCLLATRQYDPQRTQFIGSRRSVEGDPMSPSRLFFAADDETVTKRVRRFFAEHHETPPRIKFASQKDTPLVVFDSPKIAEHAGQEIKEMSVTEFAKYKKCPYRYYLECRVKPRLQTLSDESTELDAGTFGSLIHDALELFGKTKELKNSTSAKSIRDFLVQTLREKVRQQYGERPRTVISIQAERAIRRLEAFADWQANWALEHEIVDTELPFTGDHFSLDVDGKRMGLRGRIDRIDRHKTTNELIIWDYKTGNSADPKQHIKNGEWIDFQLPLYYHLLSQHTEYSGFLRQGSQQQGFRLGYILLPPKATQTGGKFADWDRDMVLSAIDEARQIVRCLWNNEFEKTVPPPKYSEAFAAICGEF